MKDLITDITQTISNNLLTQMLSGVQDFFLNVFNEIMECINNGLWSFWSEPIVIKLLDCALILSLLSLIIGTVFLFNDMAEQIEQIDIKIVLFSWAKALVFAFGARWIAASFFVAANMIVSNINFKIDANILGVFSQISTGALFSTLGLIVLVVALIVFFFLQIGRFAALFIHMFSAFAYIPFIVCGDTQKMKEWISMALSIALTYVLQYVCFYSSLVLMLSGKYIMGAIFISASFMAAKELKHLGHSTGTASSLKGTASMAYQAVAGMKSLGVM